MSETVTAAELRREAAEAMPERELQENVRQLCKRLGCLYYHTHRSDRSPAGFPDCVIVTNQSELIFAELKNQKALPSPAQRAWLDALEDVTERVPWQGVYLWRPMDWLDGTIERALIGCEESQWDWEAT